MTADIAWLGIGAQRSGTTWFTDLLLQSPDVSLGRSARKELHSFISELLDGTDPNARRSWRQEFDVDGLAGEFTPAYLRATWIAPTVARMTGEAPILVLLRDPVDRFESAMRFAIRSALEGELKDEAGRRRYTRRISDIVQWTGMYATQLQQWSRHVARHRMIVLQYEAVRQDPQAAVGRVWDAIGATHVSLQQVDEKSWTSTYGPEWSLSRVPELHEALVDLYLPEVEQLSDSWGIDPALWPRTVGVEGLHRGASCR